jgi:autotransporter passenger strand-loop-strand repeat protein
MRLGLETVGYVRVRRERQIATVGRRAGTGGLRAYRIASGRTGVHAIAGVPQRAQNRLYGPNPRFNLSRYPRSRLQCGVQRRARYAARRSLPEKIDFGGLLRRLRHDRIWRGEERLRLSLRRSILSKGVENVYSYFAKSTQASGGGIESIESGCSGYYENVYSRGRINLSSGCVDSKSYVYSGGHEFVSNGLQRRPDYFTTVESGGFLSAHGLAYETTVSKGGTQTILSAGVDDYAQIYGVENIFTGKLGPSRLTAVAPAT